MRKTLYVDMDGVLSDFERRYKDKFGMTPQEVRADRAVKRFSTHWKQFIDDAEFATLDTFHGAGTLVTRITRLQEQHKFDIAILTSSGGFDRHFDVAMQKMEWLESQCIDWAPIVVPGKRFKAGFANDKSFLIDDTPANVDNFINAGGHAALHSDVDKTIEELTRWLENK